MMNAAAFNELCNAHELTFTQVAYLTNTTPRTVRRWSAGRGESPPTPGPVPCVVLTMWDRALLPLSCIDWRRRFNDSKSVRPYALTADERAKAGQMMRETSPHNTPPITQISEATGLSKSEIEADIIYDGPRALDALLTVVLVLGYLPIVTGFWE